MKKDHYVLLKFDLPVVSAPITADEEIELERMYREQPAEKLDEAIRTSPDGSLLSRARERERMERAHNQAFAVIEHLGQNPSFSFIEEHDVIAAHTGDIDPGERRGSLFITPAPGKNTGDTFASVVLALGRMGAAVKRNTASSTGLP